MRKKSLKFYLLIVAALLFAMSIPEKTVEKARGAVIALFSPASEKLHATNTIWMEDEITRLELENHLMKAELDELKTLLQMKAAPSNGALPARVIFRSPASWSHSFWVNVGHEDSEIVAKDSPVLMGTAIVGVIDYAGKHQSRVRLITDPGLNPAVRAVREVEGKKVYLAKGELQGSIHPLFRTGGYVLQGVGFNYDFADEQGPARDLRSEFPIVKRGDLLVTSGMDGVFPAGLEVGSVIDILSLKEGDYTYTLTAKPAIDNFDKLSLVFIIPPLGFDPADKPPPLGF